MNRSTRRAEGWRLFDTGAGLAIGVLFMLVLQFAHSSAPAALTTASTPTPAATPSPIALSICGESASRTAFSVCVSTGPGVLVALSVDYCAVHEASDPFDRYQPVNQHGQFTWDWTIDPAVAPTCNGITFHLSAIHAQVRPGEPVTTSQWTMPV